MKAVPADVLNAIDLGTEGAGIFADEGGLDILDLLLLQTISRMRKKQ